MTGKESKARWLLPDGIDELMPQQAAVLEHLRRNLLDMFYLSGYDLIQTPFIEYLDSLLSGSGSDLDSQTFKVTDPLTGRLMGVRADMTLQAARIDAHRIQHDEPVRLCYLGTVLRTRPEGFAGSRSPLQVGAELYGHAGLSSDLEILELMLETLSLTGVSDVHIDLGHVGIFRGLAKQAGLDAESEASLFGALQRKAIPEISEIIASLGLDAQTGSMLQALAELNGGVETLGQARKVLAHADNQVMQSLDELDRMASELALRRPDLPVHFDLAELRGYAYQTGLVFAAFVPGHGQEIARGGRYDEIGGIFGRARPATGFSADLKTLVMLSGGFNARAAANAVFAPDSTDQALREVIRQLRARGVRVIQALPGQQGDARAMGCDRILQKNNDQWQVVPLQ